MLNLRHTHPLLRLLDRPNQRFTKRFASDGAAGLPDGRQVLVSPIKGTVVLQLAHQSGVHEYDQMHVPGLAQAVSQLTLAHPQLLLSVTMKGLRPRPASLVDFQHVVCFPVRSVGDQDFTRSLCVSLTPQYQNAHAMFDIGQAYALGAIPLGVTCDREFGSHEWRERFGPRAHFQRRLANLNHAIGFEITNIRPTSCLNVIENRSVGKIAIKGEIARYVFSYYPVDQVDTELGVVTKGMVSITLLALAEAPEVEWVVLAMRMNIRGQ